MEVHFPGPGIGRSILTVFFVIAAFVAAGLFSAGNPGWLVALGIGLVCVAGRLAQPESRVATLLGSDRGVITLELYGGGAFDVSRASLTEARLTQRTQQSSSGSGSSTTYGAAIGKRDGGMIRVVGDGPNREKAQGFVDRIQEILDATPADDESEEALIGRMHTALEESPHVSVESLTTAGGYRQGSDSALSVSWSLRTPWGQALSGVIGAGGFIGIGVGLTLIEIGFIAYVFTALLSGLGIYTLFRTLQDQGAKQTLVVDGENLVCTRARGQTILDERRIPVGGIDAVDVGWQTGIVLRLDGANADIRAMADATKRGGFGTLGAVARGLIAMTRNTMTVPTGALPMDVRVAIETVVGAEIAKRSGRAASEL